MRGFSALASALVDVYGEKILIRQSSWVVPFQG